MKKKIIRTTTRAEGGITPEERKQMGGLVKKWTKIAFRVEPINKEKITDAIYRLYESANLKKPRVVIVPSPYIMTLVYGLSAGIWYLRKNKKTDFFATATTPATHAATHAATHDATYAATHDATHDATDAAKKNWLKKLAIHFVGKENSDLLISCISKWYKNYQGGNMWAWFPCYVEAMRDIIGLKGLDCWEKYKPWEDAAKEGGFRVMHEEFCIVSDFPEWILVDEKNRSHSEIKASHRWRDGFEIYHLHGVRFEKSLWEDVVNKRLSLQEIAVKITNTEQRIVAMQYLGGKRMAEEMKNVDIIAEDEFGKVVELPVKDALNNSYRFLVATDPSKNEDVWIRIPPNIKTPREAEAWSYQIEDYQPKLRT